MKGSISSIHDSIKIKISREEINENCIQVKSPEIILLSDLYQSIFKTNNLELHYIYVYKFVLKTNQTEWEYDLLEFINLKKILGHL